MTDHGLKVRDDQIEIAESYARDAGARAASRLLVRDQRATALVAANDLLALGCYDTIRSMGLRCPADLSITGYNDMPFVDLVSPALTTVRIQHQELGAEAARLLLRKLEEPKSPVVERILRRHSGHSSVDVCARIPDPAPGLTQEIVPI